MSKRGRKIRHAAVLAAALACAPATLAFGQLNWDPDPASAGAQGGSGVWSLDASNLNWNNGTGNVAYAPSAVAFAGDAMVLANVTLDSSFGALSAPSIQFNSSHLLSGSPLELTSGLISGGPNGSSHIASNLNVTAPSGFTKSGSNTLTLSGSNNLGSAVTVLGGTLRIDSSSALITAGKVTTAPDPGSVSDIGRLLINTSLSMSGAFDNFGFLSIQPGASLNFGPSKLDTRRSLFVSSTGKLTMAPGSTFAYNGGSVQGTVNMAGGTLAIGVDTQFSGNGGGTFVFTGSGSIIGDLSGKNIPAALRLDPTEMQAFQTLTVTASSFTTTNNLTVGSSASHASVVFDWGAGTTLTNSTSGSLVVNSGVTSAAQRHLAGGYLVNNGSFIVNSATTAHHLTHVGTLSIAPSASLTVDTFTYTSGTVSGAVSLGRGGPAALTLPTSGSPSGTFSFNNTLSGALNTLTIPTNVTVRLEPTTGSSGSTQLITGPSNLTNNGTLVLGSFTNGDAGVSLTLGTSASVASLTNTGTLSVNPGSGGGGARYLPYLYNTPTGVVNINTNTTLGSGQSFGQITIAPGVTLDTLPRPSSEVSGFVRAGFFNFGSGTLTIGGLISTDAFGNTSTGTVSGNVLLRGASSGLAGVMSPALVATFQPTGNGTLDFSTSSGTLLNNGSISISPLIAGSTATVTGTMTNSGTLSFAGSAAATRTFFQITNNPTGVINVNAPASMLTLTNTGTINVNAPASIFTSPGQFTQGSFTNSGTISVNDVLTFNTLTNTGAINVSAGKTLSATNVKQTSGSLTLPGVLRTTTFTYNGGTISGTVRINEGGALVNLPITGALPSGDWTFHIAGPANLTNAPKVVPTGSAYLFAPTASTAGSYSYTVPALTNFGTVIITALNADHDVNIALGVSLNNSGTFSSNPGPGGGGTRSMGMILRNEHAGHVDINTHSSLTRLLNAGTASVAPGKSLALTGSSPAFGQEPGALINVGPGATLSMSNSTWSGGDMFLSGDATNPAKLLMSGTMTYTSGSAPAQILSGPGALRGRMVLSGAAAFNIADGAATVDTRITADISGAPLVKQGAGTLSVDRLDDIAVDVPAGTLRVASSDGTAFLSALAVAGTGALDLRDNDVVVDSANFTTIRQLVIAGFGSATGITSSTSDGSEILALFDNALVGQAQWEGQPIAPNAIVGKYTYFGDTNLDGDVTGDDYTVIDANLSTTPLPGFAWLAGDANLDGSVTGDDYTVLDANLGLGAGLPLSPSRIAVPEPAAGMIVLLASMGLARMRRGR